MPVVRLKSITLSLALIFCVSVSGQSLAASPQPVRAEHGMVVASRKCGQVEG